MIEFNVATILFVDKLGVILKLIIAVAMFFGVAFAYDEPVLDRTTGILVQAMRLHNEQLAVLANNAANAQTPGFRSLQMAVDNQGGVLTATTRFARESGVPVETRYPLHLMVEGEGYFVLSAPWGEEVYTRDGRFMRDPAQGLIVSVAWGYPLLLDSGPVVLPADSKYQFSSTGHLLLEGTSLGQLRIAQFSDKQSLEALSGSLFRKKDASVTPVEAVSFYRIRSGVYEAGVADLSRLAVDVSGVRNRFDALTTALQRKITSLTSAVQAATQ